MVETDETGGPPERVWLIPCNAHELRYGDAPDWSQAYGEPGGPDGSPGEVEFVTLAHAEEMVRDALRKAREADTQ
jgi:hypothetical protein